MRHTGVQNGLNALPYACHAAPLAHLGPARPLGFAWHDHDVYVCAGALVSQLGKEQYLIHIGGRFTEISVA